LNEVAAKEMTSRFFRRAFVILALLPALVQTGRTQASQKAPESSAAGTSAVTYAGGMVSPALPKPKFTLTDTSGNPYDFAAKTQGNVALLFFGYTHCPDMCPIQMYLIEQALKKLTPQQAAQFSVVFVTTDPARDTPAVLRTWLDHFDKRFVGLTGTEKEIDAAQIAANLEPAKKSAVRPDGAYEVGHAAFVLAYTKDNLAHVIYPVGVKAEDLAHDLPYLAKEQWNGH
jgi:protein SCO1/2